MAFRHLDGDRGLLAGAYTIGYKITDDTGEYWTNRFSRFKAKELAASWGGSTVLYRAVPPLLGALGLNPAKTLFVAALSSGETHASADGVIPHIALECAKSVGAGFELNALSKQVHNPIHGIYNADARSAELDKAAYVAAKVNARSVVVFDDMITRGDTLSRISEAFSSANGSVQVYGIALAKTERRSWIPDISNAHVPEIWDDAWKEGEAKYMERQRQ